MLTYAAYADVCCVQAKTRYDSFASEIKAQEADLIQKKRFMDYHRYDYGCWRMLADADGC
jgi:hypothetical protein